MRLLALILPALLATGCGQRAAEASSGPGEAINPGAVVPIHARADRDWMHAEAGRAPGADRPTGWIDYGQGGLRESIHLAYGWHPVAGIMLHEYEHLIERRLKLAGEFAAMRIVRQAFLDITGPGFDIGRPDLMEPLP